MKAIEYFKKYKTENQDKSPEWRIIMTFRQMVLEVKEIAKMRNAQKDDALISIFNEQNRKANSFIKMVNIEKLNSAEQYKTDGLKIFLLQSDPELSNLIGWKNEEESSD